MPELSPGGGPATKDGVKAQVLSKHSFAQVASRVGRPYQRIFAPFAVFATFVVKGQRRRCEYRPSP